jgi:hypothetical protein
VTACFGFALVKSSWLKRRVFGQKLYEGGGKNHHSLKFVSCDQHMACDAYYAIAGKVVRAERRAKGVREVKTVRAVKEVVAKVERRDNCHTKDICSQNLFISYNRVTYPSVSCLA